MLFRRLFRQCIENNYQTDIKYHHKDGLVNAEICSQKRKYTIHMKHKNRADLLHPLQSGDTVIEIKNNRHKAYHTGNDQRRNGSSHFRAEK